MALLVVLSLDDQHAMAGLLFFSENFSGATVSSNLSVPAGWVFGPNASPNGVAQNLANQNDATSRTYISTVATNYNTVDFCFEVSFSIAGGNDGKPVAFVGMGSGQQESNFFYEPASSIYLRQFPSGFASGESRVSISSPAQLPPSEYTISGSPGPGDGSYRAQISKLGDSITVALDSNYTGGAFVADYSLTKSLSADLNFLNSTNSRLFFGAWASSTTFDNLSISPVPEINPAGMGSVLALVTGALGLLERRRMKTA